MSERGEIDLTEWWAVSTGGECWWAGKNANRARGGDSRQLENLQKLVFQHGMIETPQGLRPHIVTLTFPWFGIETLAIPEGCLWTSCSAYKGVPWAEILGSTEKLKLEQRAQRSGLHLASH
jgi:hypothetical protein